MDARQCCFTTVDSLHNFVLKADFISAVPVSPLGSSLMKVANVGEVASWFQMGIEDSKYKQTVYGYHTNEYLQVFYLDKLDQVLWSLQFSSGRKNQVRVKIKDIFQGALRSGAEKILLLHNHPSGSVQPGKSDLYLTRRICQAGDLLGIALVDHVIVGKDKYFSFRENGVLKNSIDG